MNKLKQFIYNRVTKWSEQESGRSPLFIPRRQAGVYVDEDIAMTYSAVWRAINLISSSISILPWHINKITFTQDGSSSRSRLLTHPASNILDLAANEDISAQAWRETILAHALSWGNGYSEIERDMANRPVALHLIEPTRVTPSIADDGRLVYRVKNNGREDSILESRDMYHLKGLGFNGLSGYSVIGYAAKSIGVGIATETFGAAFFENGASFNGVFEHPNALGDDAIKHLRQSLQDMHSGPTNANKPLILEEGMKWTATSIPPNDAQFLETRKFNVAEIARWYGIPLHKLMEMEQATFSNIEHQSIEFVQDALMPWIRRLEIEANLKLVSPANRGRIYTKINVNALLRGDLATRGEWYTKMRNLGVYSADDIRALEDMNPLGSEQGGDKYLVQLNQTTLEKIGEESQQQQQPAPADPEADDDKESPQMRTLMDSIRRCQMRERQRAVDAIKRYDGDRDGIIKWMNKFYQQHMDYMLQNLKNPVDAVSESIDLTRYIVDHISENRLNILTAFDNGDEEPTFMTLEDETIRLIGDL